MTQQHQLADAIAGVLGQGMRISGKTMAYIEATFSISDGSDIAAVLNNPSHDDHDLLLELLLYPDAIAQMKLEPLIQGAAFSSDDVEVIASIVGARRMVVPLFRNDDASAFTRLPLSEYGASRYISRLNIHWKPSAELRQCLGAFPAGEVKLKIMVKLRDANIEPLEGHADFICRFLSKSSPDSPDLLPSLGYLLSILPDKQNITDTYAFLVERKQFHFLSIGMARKAAQYLSKNNMETRMMQGVRMPHVDIEDAKEKMRLIDGICRAVFGKTEYFAPAPGSVDLGKVQTLGDLGQLLKRVD